MAGKRYSVEQIIGYLKEAEVLLTNGISGQCNYWLGV